MTCRGCDKPIEFDTYCKRCLEEIEACISARPFVWPQWVIVARDTLLALLLIGLVIFCFCQAYIDLTDGSI